METERARTLARKTKRACGELQRLGGSLVCMDEHQAKGIAEKSGGLARASEDHPDAKLFKPDAGVWLVDFPRQGELPAVEDATPESETPDV